MSSSNHRESAASQTCNGNKWETCHNEHGTTSQMLLATSTLMECFPDRVCGRSFDEYLTVEIETEGMKINNSHYQN